MYALREYQPAIELLTQVGVCVGCGVGWGGVGWGGVGWGGVRWGAVEWGGVAVHVDNGAVRSQLQCSGGRGGGDDVRGRTGR